MLDRDDRGHVPAWPRWIWHHRPQRSAGAHAGASMMQSDARDTRDRRVVSIPPRPGRSSELTASSERDGWTARFDARRSMAASGTGRVRSVRPSALAAVVAFVDDHVGKARRGRRGSSASAARSELSRTISQQISTTSATHASGRVTFPGRRRSAAPAALRPYGDFAGGGASAIRRAAVDLTTARGHRESRGADELQAKALDDPREEHLRLHQREPHPDALPRALPNGAGQRRMREAGAPRSEAQGSAPGSNLRPSQARGADAGGTWRDGDERPRRHAAPPTTSSSLRVCRCLEGSTPWGKRRIDSWTTKRGARIQLRRVLGGRGARLAERGADVPAEAPLHLGVLRQEIERPGQRVLPGRPRGRPQYRDQRHELSSKERAACRGHAALRPPVAAMKGGPGGRSRRRSAPQRAASASMIRKTRPSSVFRERRKRKFFGRGSHCGKLDDGLGVVVRVVQRDAERPRRWRAGLGAPQRC